MPGTVINLGDAGGAILSFLVCVGIIVLFVSVLNGGKKKGNNNNNNSGQSTGTSTTNTSSADTTSK